MKVKSKKMTYEIKEKLIEEIIKMSKEVSSKENEQIMFVGGGIQILISLGVTNKEESLEITKKLLGEGNENGIIFNRTGKNRKERR